EHIEIASKILILYHFCRWAILFVNHRKKHCESSAFFNEVFRFAERDWSETPQAKRAVGIAHVTGARDWQARFCARRQSGERRSQLVLRK
ncbi:MAG: hypothetical protein J6Z79_00780, partial [Clostridia bacterium]|nr:hypothetical protein [Clostridia bacterium]